MLSLLLLEQYDAMKHIADFYFPSGRILDVSYGNGSLVSTIRTRVTGLDLDPSAPADICADSTKMPVLDTAYEAVIFDPPYLFGRQKFHLHNDSKTRPGWSNKNPDKKTDNYTPEQFAALVMGTIKEAFRVLKSEGILVVKICDSRWKGRLILNHVVVLNAGQEVGFDVRDILIYTRLGTGIFRNNRTAQAAHGFFLIFQKRSGGSLTNEGPKD